MTISADVYEVALLIISIAVLVFVIAVIPTLTQLKRTIKAVEDLTVESRRTVEGVNVIVKKIGEQTQDVDELVKSVKDVGFKVTGLANLIVDNIKSPVISLLSFIFGAEEGFKRFFRRDKKGGNGDGKD